MIQPTKSEDVVEAAHQIIRRLVVLTSEEKGILLQSMTQPTHSREAIQAAHDAVEQLRSDGLHECANRIDAVLPPIPELERPKITPARELAKKINDDDNYSTSKIYANQRAISERTAEIIALLEFVQKDCMDRNHGSYEGIHLGMTCPRCHTLLNLIEELREADA
jgi:hypothetical protein